MLEADWERGVLVFSIICQGLLLWRLWSQKLWSVYLFLTGFLAWETIQDIIELPVKPRSTLYSWVFLLTTPVLWILAFLVVLELYRLILEDYPGIASLGRKAVSWSIVLAVVVSAAYTIPDLRASTGPFPVLRVFAIVERSTVLGLLLFLVLIQLFLLRYRLRLSPNRVVYATGYALYFAVTMAQDVVITAMGIQVVYSFNLWVVAAGGVILLVGATLLKKAGEVKPQLEAVDSSADRARLQQQLADINRLLSRAARSRG
jgi:hypothetical protein